MSNYRHKTLLGLLIVLVAIGTWLAVPDSVAAQGTGHWKVITITPGDQGAQKLEAELNKGDYHWELHSLHMSTIQGLPGIAVLRRK